MREIPGYRERRVSYEGVLLASLLEEEPLRPDTIVYIVEAVPGERDVERFGIVFMRDHGLTVEVWDVHDIFLPGAPDVERSSENGVVFRRYSELSMLVEACSRLKSNCLVVLVSGAYRGQFVSHLRMLRALTVSGARLGAVSAGQRPPIPHRSMSRPFGFEAVQRACRQVRLLRSGRRTLAELGSLAGQRLQYQFHSLTSKFRYRKVRPLDWIWAGTNVDSIEPLLVGPQTRIRLIHTWDYDLILSEGKSLQRFFGPVYLDAMGPLHPDFAALGITVNLEPDSWFTRVNSALFKIDRAMGRAVAVAAHPRATFRSMDGCYPGRAVWYGKTPELIRDASLVIVSDPTTALGYAVIFKKPVLILQGPTLFETHTSELLQYADLLGLEVRSLDSIPEDWQPASVEESNYAAFRQRYIKTDGSPQEPFWSLVLKDVLIG